MRDATENMEKLACNIEFETKELMKKIQDYKSWVAERR